LEVDKNLNQNLVVLVDINGAGPSASTKACWLCQRHVVFATGTTSNQLPNNHAWSAAAAPPTPTI
jgi:hypothetical protein